MIINFTDCPRSLLKDQTVLITYLSKKRYSPYNEVCSSVEYVDNSPSNRLRKSVNKQMSMMNE